MCIAVIVGAGKGKRMKSKENKILLPLREKPVIYHAIKRFEECARIGCIILVVNKDDEEEIRNLAGSSGFKKITRIVRGGKERQDSVYNGMMAAGKARDDEIILIHNAANPHVSGKTINDVIEAAREFGAAAAGMRSEDTLKEVDEEGFVANTIDRARVWRMQTPQAFKFSVAKEAFMKAYSEGYYATDDASLVERIGVKVKVVETNKENIKITTPEDMAYSEKIVSCPRIGIGQDSHRFDSRQKKLFLGGVLIENEPGLEANSDGDVILHAVFNALAQAMGMRSIGCYADKLCREKGVTDSKEYVKLILGKVKENGFLINNIGIMVEAKKPRLEMYHDKIKKSIAGMLETAEDRIGLTFTSGEELTDFGKGLGMQCFAVVSLARL